jgi:integrase
MTTALQLVPPEAMPAAGMTPDVAAALEVLKRAFGGFAVPTGPTVGDLWAKYELAERDQVKSFERSESCWRRLRDYFSSRPALGLTMFDIDEWRAEQKKATTNRGKAPCASTRNRALVVLCRLLNWSLDRGLIDRTPLTRLKLEKENNLRETVLTDADVDKILAAAKGRPVIQLLVLVLFDTGCRRSEVLRLKWEQIDAEKRCLRLTAKDTKNKRPRRPHLTKRALDALLAFPRRHPTSPYVFASRETGEVISVRNVYRDYEMCVARAGLWGVNGETICLHSLRHAFIAKARRLHMPERVVMAQTGHLTRCAFDRYGGAADDDELATLVAAMEGAERPVKE